MLYFQDMKISTRCPYEQSHKIIPNTYSVVKTGTIKNKAKKVIQRFQCKACGKYFSTNRILGIHKQRKPELNELIFSLYSKGMTQRGIAEVLKINEKTVNAKIIMIAKKCQAYHQTFISKGFSYPKPNKPIFIYDEMETHEQTKLKPLSIGVSYDFYNRKIIHMNVCRMKTRGRGMAAQFEAIRELKGWKKRKDGRYRIGIESFLVMDEYSKNQSKCLLLTDDKTLYLNTFRFLDPKKWQHVHARSDLPIVLLNKKKKWKTLVFKSQFKLSDKYVFAKAPFNVDIYETRTLLYEKLLNSAMKSYQKLCAVIRNDTSRLRRTTFINTQKSKMLELNLAMFIAYYNNYDFHQIMTYK